MENQDAATEREELGSRQMKQLPTILMPGIHVLPQIEGDLDLDPCPSTACPFRVNTSCLPCLALCFQLLLAFTDFGLI